MAWFIGLKAAVFALLAVNALAFSVVGTISEALDSIARFALLVLFEVETRLADAACWRRLEGPMRAVRLAATLAIGAAAIGYLHERAWLDALNAWLWIAVVVLLEVEVRHPDVVLASRLGFGGASAALYSGLVCVVLAWLWQGEWFDAYDASLWIIAFVTIEMNVLNLARRAEAPVSGESAGELRRKA